MQGLCSSLTINVKKGNFFHDSNLCVNTDSNWFCSAKGLTRCFGLVKWVFSTFRFLMEVIGGAVSFYSTGLVFPF